MKKTIWQPLVLGIVLGSLAGLTIVTGLSFLTPGINANAIGIYGTLLLISAALGGPLAGVAASTLFVIISAMFGMPDMKAVITIPAIFWSNLLASATILVLVSLAYRFIFERLKIPKRLLPWAGIVIAYYFLVSPASIISQTYLLGDPVSEIIPSIIYSYQSYIPQAIFDIFITCLVFIALPARYLRPLWYELRKMPDSK